MSKPESPPGEESRPPGRPPKPIDIEVLKRAARIGCSPEEIAALLGISRPRFYARLKEIPGLQEILDEARDEGKVTLRRYQWQRAKAGSDTMLIWLGKNLLKQTDKLAHTGGEDGDNPIAIRHTYGWKKADPEPKPE